ncbi:MAG: DUF5011 domain-containing protein [Bacteroidetes bacterium]|nr:DUF5011 domain-containing protein [Bacteroidota bacterium]
MRRLITLLSFILFMGFGSQVVAQSYCTPSYNATCCMGFSNVQFGTINQSSAYGNGYENYSSVTPANVFAGLTKTITFTTVAYDMYVVVWIDLNKDGDFTDAGELIYNSGSAMSPGTYTKTLMIPASASAGNTRLRISAQYYYYAVNTNPCGAFYYGDVEDYTINIIPLSGFDCALTSVDSPAVFGVDSNKLSVTFTNMKADTIYWLDMGYSLNGGTPELVYDYNINGNAFGKLSPGQGAQYTFAKSVFVPTKGNHNLKVWVANVNDSIPDNNKVNDTLDLNFCTGMGGVYTVGAGQDYTTLNDAYNALKTCGILAPVVFDVKAGTYSENLVLEPVLGMTEVNTVTFQGASKSSVIMNTSASAAIEFDAADYFRFENMTINGSGYCVLWYHNNANHNIVYNCDLNGNTSTTSSAYNVILSSSSVSSYSGYGINGTFNEVSGCLVNGGYCGASLNGSSTSNVDMNWILKENTFINQYYYGIRLYYMGKVLIERNTLKDFRYASSYGIYNYYGMGVNINANTINPGTYGIYSYYNNYYSTIPDSSFITNNFIYDFLNTTNQLGMQMYYNYNNHVWHNTVKVEGTSNDPNYPAIRFYYYQTGSTCANNILVSTDASFLLNFYYTYNGVDIDQNLYIYPTTTGYDYFYCYYPEIRFKNFTTFQPYTFTYLNAHDENSLDNEDPHFVSATDMHLINSYPPIKVDNAGLFIDVDGDSRCIYETAIGADEPNFAVQKPTSGFISEDTVCSGSPITFVNVAGVDAKQGYWWYHDGKFKGTDRNYSYTFGAGTYTDTIMLITENCGGKDTFSKIIVIAPPTAKPLADFVSDLNLVETAFPVQFYDISQNCPDSWKWSVSPDSVNDPGFGKMPSITYLPPTHSGHQNPWISFDYPGTYTVCLIASNILGADTICKQNYIVVKPSQWLCMYVFPSVSKSLLGILFDDGGPISDYQANTNCDITLEPCASSLTFEFSEFNVQAGDFFRVYDGIDNTGTVIWDDTNYPDGMTGNLTDANFQSSYTSNSGQMFLEWSTNASGQSAGFIGEWYGVAATYPAPTAMFTGPDTICLGMPATFENLSTGTNLTYSWDFDGDNFFDAFEENPTYTYMFWPGTFTVKLTVEDCGGMTTYSRDVVVIQPAAAPTPDFTTDSRFPVAGEDFVQFTDLTHANTSNPYGCMNNWEWTVSPDTMLQLGIWVKSHRYVAGTNSNSQNPIILFEDTGYYTITLISGYDMNYNTETKVDYIYAIKYCRPTVSNLNPDIGISRVALASIDNTSAIGKDAYSNYSNDASTFLDLQGGYTLTLERNSAYNTMNRKAWIDWNIDGDFDDAGEEIGVETEASTLVWNKNFTVPANATEGATRLRVAATLGSSANNNCGNRAYGEVEDYRVIVRPDGTPPVITLDTFANGETTAYIEQCDCTTYADPGATAEDNIDGVVSAYYIDDNIDCMNYGTYYYRYEAKDSKGNTEIKDRMIVVNMDMDAPSLTLNGKLVDTLNYMASYMEAGWVADDTCSGFDRVDVMGTVDTFALGDYEITYTAYDMNGNTTTATRMVYVRDLVDPSISLNGYSIMDIEVHNAFNDPGVAVSDNYPCNKLEAVVSGGPVDIHTLGSYTLVYEITDCNGNGPVSVTRVVNVVDTTAPVIIIAQPNYDGEAFTLEVYDYFKLPMITELDNYKVNSVVEGGTYVSEFGMEGQSTKLGTFNYTYTVLDESGNSSFVEFTIEVVDTEKPVISLIGGSVVNLCRYKELAKNEYSIDDNYDTGLMLDDDADGTYFSDYMVNKYWGFYTIIYNTEDNSGNKADEVVRYVNVQECSWNGVEESGLEQYVKMYPNPTKGEFYISVELPQSENLLIKVSNMLGDELEIITKSNTQGGMFKVDLGAYADGVYFVQVQTDEASTVQKVTLAK